MILGFLLCSEFINEFHNDFMGAVTFQGTFGITRFIPAVSLSPQVEFVYELRAVGEEDDPPRQVQLRGEPQAEREGVKAERLGGRQLHKAGGGLHRKHQRAPWRGGVERPSQQDSSPWMLLRH